MSASMRMHLVSAWVAVACAAVCAAAMGPPELTRESIGAISADANAVIIVNGAGAQRDGDVARALTGLLHDANLLTEPVREAWCDLSRRLEWDEERAFAELLGHRLIYLHRAASAQDTDWALVTLVTDPARGRILQNIDLAPRFTKGGRIVNAGEGGQFLLAIGPVMDGWSRVLIARRDDAEFFERSLALLTGECVQGCLSEHPAFARTPMDLTADAVVIVRTGASLTTLSADVHEGGIRADMAVASDAGEGRAAPTAAWSGAMLNRLDEGAFGVFLGSIDQEHEGLSLLADCMLMGGLSDVFDERPAGRIAVVAEPEGEAQQTLAVTLALETHDVTRTSRRADQAMAEIIADIDKLFDVRRDGEPAASDQSQYHLPAASVRTHSLAAIAALAPGSPMGDEPVLAWVGVPWGDVRTKAGPPAHMVARTGWWAVSLSAKGRQPWPAQVICERLSEESFDQAPAYVSLGVIRPRMFAKWLAAEGANARTDQLSALMWIDEITWALRPGEGGALEGELRIDMHTGKDDGE